MATPYATHTVNTAICQNYLKDRIFSALTIVVVLGGAEVQTPAQILHTMFPLGMHSTKKLKFLFVHLPRLIPGLNFILMTHNLDHPGAKTGAARLTEVCTMHYIQNRTNTEYDKHQRTDEVLANLSLTTMYLSGTMIC